MMMDNSSLSEGESFSSVNKEIGSESNVSNYSSDSSTVEAKYQKMTLKDINKIISNYSQHEEIDTPPPSVKFVVEPRSRKGNLSHVPARTPKRKAKRSVKPSSRKKSVRKRKSSSVTRESPTSKMLKKNIMKLKGEIVALEARNKLQQRIFTGARRKVKRKKKKKKKILGQYRIQRPCRTKKCSHRPHFHRGKVPFKKVLKTKKSSISKKVSRIDSQIEKIEEGLKNVKENVTANTVGIDDLRNKNEKMFEKYSSRFGEFEKKYRKKMKAMNQEMKSKLDVVNLNTSQNSRKIEMVEKRNDRMEETMQRHARQLDKLNVHIAKFFLQSSFENDISVVNETVEESGLPERVPKVDDYQIESVSTSSCETTPESSFQSDEAESEDLRSRISKKLQVTGSRRVFGAEKGI